MTPQEALALAHELKQYRHDPLMFVKVAYPWGEPGTALERFTGPRQWQADLLGHVGERLRAGQQLHRVAVASGHGIGKTALMAMFRAWAMSTITNCRGVVTANTMPQLRSKTLPEFAKWHGMQINRDWFEGNETYRCILRPDLRETWRFDALPWNASNPAAFQGLHNLGNRILVLFDEASEIERIIWEAIQGTFSDEDTEIIFIAFGNPTVATGSFRECFGSERSRYFTRHIDSRTVEGTNKAELAEQVEREGEDSDFVRVRIRGVFPRRSSTQFIGTDLAEGAATREAECWPSDALVVGVDVARFGDDQSVIVRRRGRDSRTWPPLKFRGLDTMQLAARVASIHASDRPDAIFVDEGGVGGGVVDRLRQLGVPVTGVNFGAKPDSGTLQEAGAAGERYANKRAEMWGVLREWLRRGAIPNDRELLDDLTGVEYGYNADNAIQLERKEDMKKRGLSSPDCFIAGTMILTPAGYRRIEDIREGDEVLTPWAVRKVIRTWVTTTDELTGAVFSNGYELIGKGKHQIFTWDAGFVRLDALSMVNEIETDSTWRLLGWRKLASSITKGSGTGFSRLVDTFSPTGKMYRSGYCIAVSGMTGTGRSRLGITSIIRMAIGRTIGSTTSNWSRAGDITASTCLRATRLAKGEQPASPAWRLGATLLERGIVRMQDAFGMPSMAAEAGKAGSLQWHGVSDAAESSQRSFHIGRSSAPSPARRRWLSAVTSLSSASAWRAALNSLLIGTEPPAIVPALVQTVTVPKPVPVYNITLDDDNVYYANGVLVRNCADALALTFAYPVVARGMESARVKPRTFDPFAEYAA